MKHFYISLILFFTILTASFASHIYFENTIKDMSRIVNPMRDVKEVTRSEIEASQKVEDLFYKNKNVLRYFVNKEHIQKIEVNILLLKDAACRGDRDKVRENSLEIISMLNHIDDYRTTLD